MFLFSYIKTHKRWSMIFHTEKIRWDHYYVPIWFQLDAFVVYNQNHYFGLGPIPKPKPKLADTFSRYRSQYRNHISKGKSSYQQYGVFFQS